MKNNIQIIKSILLIQILLILIVSKPVFADEIFINGNGSGSQNEVYTTQEVNNVVTQSNNANITTTVEESLTTGNNSATGNTDSGVNITTGDTSSVVSVTNSGNSSQVSQGECCQQQENIINISGNGSDSRNTVQANENIFNTVSISNNATVTNVISGNAVTGNNSANDNNGSVLIKTGNILVSNTIKNSPFNLAQASLVFSQGSYKVTIGGNGKDSVSFVTVDQNTGSIINIINRADIFNKVIWDTLTGGNTADDNNGNVDILTGNININTEIVNGPINLSLVDIMCGCKKDNPVVPFPPTGGITPPSSSNSGGGGGGDGGSSGGSSGVLSGATGNILPATGTNWLFYALIGNMMMFMLGAYLRLRSGRSPSL